MGSLSRVISLRIADADPWSGPTSGGTDIAITGSGFLLGDLACRFGENQLFRHRFSARHSFAVARLSLGEWLGEFRDC